MKRIIYSIRPWHVLIGGILVYTAYFLHFVFTKYGYFGYNGVDLAIFNQVMWNIVHGQGAWSSVQGHHYFGDHFSPILYLLAPVYAVWQDPRMLLIVQVVAVCLTAVPVWFIARMIFANNILSMTYNGEDEAPDTLYEIRYTKDAWYALLFALAWLANPLLHNATVYEFHTYSFALLFLLSGVYFYLKKKWFPCGIALLLAFAAREDVALVVGMMGVVVIMNSVHCILPLKVRGIKGVMSSANNSPNPSYTKRGIILIGISVLWFLLAQKIISHYSPSNSYQFLTYYQWLFDTRAGEIARHIFSFSNINLVVAALLPFLFLPLLKPPWLLLSVPPVLAALFSNTGGSVVWQTHLIALWLPGLAIAAAFGYAKTIKWIESKKLHAWIVPIGLFIAVIGSGWWMGPQLAKNVSGITYNKKDGTPDTLYEIRNTKMLWHMLQDIPPHASIASSYRYQVLFSSRAELYDLRYIWLGTQQYANIHYPFHDPDFIIFSPEDIQSYFIQFPALNWTRRAQTNGEQRFKQLIQRGQYGLWYQNTAFIVLKRGEAYSPRFDDFVEVGAEQIPPADEALGMIHTIGVQAVTQRGGITIAPDRGTRLIID